MSPPTPPQAPPLPIGFRQVEYFMASLVLLSGGWDSSIEYYLSPSSFLFAKLTFCLVKAGEIHVLEFLKKVFLLFYGLVDHPYMY